MRRLIEIYKNHEIYFDVYLNTYYIMNTPIEGQETFIIETTNSLFKAREYIKNNC